MTSEQSSSSVPESRNQHADILDMSLGLHEICTVGLSHALSTAERSGGVLIVQTPNDIQPIHVEQTGLTGSWLKQISDPASPLTKLIQKGLTLDRLNHNVHFSLDGLEINDLSAACQISTNQQIQGALLIQGEQCKGPQLERLLEFLPLLGREIRAARRHDRQTLLMERTARLQAELSELALRADTDGFQRKLVANVCTLFESETSLLVLADEENPGWLTYKTLDKHGNWAYHLQPDDDLGPVSECLRTGRVISLEGENARLNFDPTCTDQQLLQARTLLCAPLKTGERNFGAILVLNKSSGPYDETDHVMLTTIGDLAASGIQTANLIQNFKVAQADQQANHWELLGSNNILRTLLEHLPASLYIINQDYRLVAVNKSRADRIGQESRELVGQSCFQTFFGFSEICPGCMVWETLQEGQITRRSERRRLGEAITEWDIDTFPILDAHGSPIQAMLLETDVTEKRHLESILMQTEKLAAVGQLAAGIAHEINNPLTAIIANAQILHRELPPDTDLQESVDLISRAGARAAQVVRNLLDFARKEEYRLGLTDINETIERAVELVQHELLAHGIQLEMDLDQDLPPILASADMLQSVWLNLLMNAIDSLDKTPEKIRVASRKTGAEMKISVTDNGVGIPADHLSHIFEPFYTTKAPGRGTGLGLSVSYRIIRQHGGHFRVESQVGEGSVFSVILPAS